MMDESAAHVFPPALCAELVTALYAVDVTEHDITLAVNHALVCERCRPAVEDFLHDRL